MYSYINKRYCAHTSQLYTLVLIMLTLFLGIIGLCTYCTTGYYMVSRISWGTCTMSEIEHRMTYTTHVFDTIVDECSGISRFLIDRMMRVLLLPSLQYLKTLTVQISTFVPAPTQKPVNNNNSNNNNVRYWVDKFGSVLTLHSQDPEPVYSVVWYTGFGEWNIDRDSVISQDDLIKEYMGTRFYGVVFSGMVYEPDENIIQTLYILSSRSCIISSTNLTTLQTTSIYTQLESNNITKISDTIYRIGAELVVDRNTTRRALMKVLEAQTIPMTSVPRVSLA